jgi:hypothetical protein
LQSGKPLFIIAYFLIKTQGFFTMVVKFQEEGHRVSPFFRGLAKLFRE